MTTIFTPKDSFPMDSDVEFWGKDYVSRDEPLGVLDSIGELANLLSGTTTKKEPRPVRLKKRGNIRGLGKHLAKRYGPQDEGFFTRCMASEELADYDEETRKAICARAHKEQIGKWPGEGRKKSCNGCNRKIRLIRRKKS